MIDLINLSIQYGGTFLFENVNLKINPGEHIALVGANGSGKSTLLRLLTGNEKPETGEIAIKKNLRIGYLPQEFSGLKGLPLKEEVRVSLPNISDLEIEEKEIIGLLESTDHSDQKYPELIDRLGEIHHLQEALDFYRINSNIEEILIGLGFQEEEFLKNSFAFSGGWRMRILLAKILLSQNDILLLDEPTNHLDFDSLSWLINFLTEYKGAYLIVSHDTYFLNSVTNKTLEIYNDKLSYYNGTYEQYIDFREEREEQLESTRLQQQKEIKHIEKFIERFRYKATKAKQVQSRIKMLEKISRIENADNAETVRIRFPDPPHSGILPLTVEGLSKSFGDNVVLDNLDLQIERGEKVALLGRNGTGKTTFVKLISDRLEPDKGKLIRGHNALVSYYAQEAAEELNPDENILEAVSNIDPDYKESFLRTVLGSFLFHGDDILKKIRVLSGGEKSRVALARMLLSKANFLILDEPTNHLDISSKAILQNALIKFPGTAVIVSHDIDFLLPLITKVVEFRKRSVKIYPGGIDYFLEKKKDEDIKIIPKNTEPIAKQPKPGKDNKRIEAELRQERYNRTKNLKNLISRIEKEIAVLEKNIQILEDKFASPGFYDDQAGARSASAEYEKYKAELEIKFASWTQFTEELEKIEAEFSGL